MLPVGRIPLTTVSILQKYKKLNHKKRGLFFYGRNEVSLPKLLTISTLFDSWCLFRILELDGWLLFRRTTSPMDYVNI